MAVLSLLLAACGSDGPSAGPGAPSTSPASAPPTVASEPGLPDTTAVAELGYPRDLLERGRVNVVVTRAGDEAFVLLDHQLRIEGFEPAPVEERRIVVPGNGQRVAIQGVFGEVVDCDAPAPLDASLAVRYQLGDDRTVHEGAIGLDDTSVLDEIRAGFCTARRVLEENEVVLGPPTLDGETFGLDLTITRRSGDAELVVHAIQGTVLFGVESPFRQGAPERALAPDAAELVLPLTFDVNRCDPHAVAETTKRTGLTLWIAVDGQPPQPVEIDIATIEDELDVILDRCEQRSGR